MAGDGEMNSEIERGMEMDKEMDGQCECLTFLYDVQIKKFYNS